MYKQFHRAYEWVSDNIIQEFKIHFGSDDILPDVNYNLFFLSHSWGGYITTDFLTKTCGDKAVIKGQIMMDPIDGFYWNKPVLNPPQPTNFTIPAIIVAHGKVYGSKPTKWCFPLEVMAPRFYECWQGPIWVINFTDYGHRDIIN